MERIQIQVFKNIKYTIPKRCQEKYGFKPGKTIIFETDGKKRVIGKIL